jgi:hypothetical protein
MAVALPSRFNEHGRVIKFILGVSLPLVLVPTFNAPSRLKALAGKDKHKRFQKAAPCS